MMAAVEERSFQGQPTTRPLKNVAKKSTTKPAQFLSRSGSSSPVSNSSNSRDSTDKLRVGINGQSKQLVEEVSSNGLASSDGDNSSDLKPTDEGIENEDPAKVTRRQIEHLEKKQEEMIRTITSRSSPVTTAGQSDSTSSSKQGNDGDADIPPDNQHSKDGDSANLSENSLAAASDSVTQAENELTNSIVEKSKTVTKLSINSKVKDSFKGILRGVVEKLQSSKSTSSSPSRSISSSASNSRTSSPKTVDCVSSVTPSSDKGNLFENMSSFTGELELKHNSKDPINTKLDSPQSETTQKDTSEDISLKKNDLEEEEAEAVKLLDGECGEDNDGDLDESILDHPDEVPSVTVPANKSDGPKENVCDENKDTSSQEHEDCSSVENLNEPCSTSKNNTKTDSDVGKGEKEQKSEKENSPPQENRIEDSETTSSMDTDTTDKESKGVKKVEKEETVSRKRSPSASPDRHAKKSRLDSMIGRLGSVIGIKPDDVEVMEETTSDSDISKEDSSSTGYDEDEVKSEDSDKITLTTEELNALILRRTEAFLSTSETGSVVAALQARVVELQTSVETWRSQAKELQKQMAEVAAKQQSRSERRRSQVHRGNTPPRTARASANPSVSAASAAGSTHITIPSRSKGVVMVSASTAGASQAHGANATARNTGAKRHSSVTVKELLDGQRDGPKSAGGAGNTTSVSASGNGSAANTVAVPRTPLKGGVIDLTDDDDLSSPPKPGTTVAQSSATGVAVRQTVSGTNLRPGTLLVQQTPNSAPVVLQQVISSQPLKTPQGTLVYTTARPGVMVQAPGLVRGTLVAAGQPPQLRPAQTMVVRQAGPSATSSRLPPPLQSAPVMGLKHPAPLPPVQVNNTQVNTSKASPPKPGLKISRVQQGIVLSWNMTLNDSYAEVSNYQLFAYQEGAAPPSTNLWKKVGDVKALPLPMACTLTQFQEGNKYHFSVRAVDQHGRIGPFSDPSSIHLLPAGASSTS